MPDKAALTIGFSAPEAAAPGEALLLEQDEWKRSAGVLTPPRAALYISRYMYGPLALKREETRWDDVYVDCGVKNGRVEITLRAYPLRPDVEIVRLAASVGSLSGLERGEIEEEETVSYTLTRETALRHPASRVLDASWLTGPYDAAGNKVAPPPLTVRDGRVLRVSGDVVWGSVKVKTLVPRWTCVLTVDWSVAAESLNEGWGEWAAAWPAGGPPAALALTPPPGAKEMAASGGCGRRSTIVSINEDDDEDWPPVAEPADRYVDCDYCKGECEGEPQ